MKISRVKISGLWGTRTANANFHEDINILVGGNGSGKTTFLQLVIACLRVELHYLKRIPFKKIEIYFSGELLNQKITLTKPENVDTKVPEAEFVYEINDLMLSLSSPAFRYNSIGGRAIPGRLQGEVRKVKEEISKRIEVFWLAVQRASSRVDMNRDDDSEEESLPEVDRALNDLLNRFGFYQSLIRQKLNAKNKELEKGILESLLYDPKFDSFESLKSFELNVEVEKEIIRNAYRLLSFELEPVALDRHFEVLKQSIEEFKRLESGPDVSAGIDIEKLSALPLYRRTRHIIEILKDIEKQKAGIRRPLDLFDVLMKDFLGNKTLIEVSSNEGGFKVQAEDGKTRHDVFSLSSGEKQIVILLLTVLLQENRQVLFASDEPELSLHVAWQRKLMDALLSLNPNAQIIVATHSPEIVGANPDKCIQMGEVIRGIN